MWSQTSRALRADERTYLACARTTGRRGVRSRCGGGARRGGASRGLLRLGGLPASRSRPRFGLGSSASLRRLRPRRLGAASLGLGSSRLASSRLGLGVAAFCLAACACAAGFSSAGGLPARRAAVVVLGSPRRPRRRALVLVPSRRSSAHRTPCRSRRGRGTVRVGANSPSLWPTIDSLMNTGTCLRPSCTAIVCPTISGKIVEVARPGLEHLLRRSPRSSPRCAPSGALRPTGPSCSIGSSA